MTEYDAVLFDNDGVLVEPPAGERQRLAARRAFTEHGVEAVADEHLAAIASGVTREGLAEICDVHGLSAADLWAARNRHDRRLQREDVETGVRTTYDDVTAVADCDLGRGVVSNNHHATVEFVLEHFAIDDLFDTAYGREPGVAALARKKPDPHYLECALDDLGAERALYVGDRASDVRAAHNAGLDSVFLRREHCRDVDLAPTPTHEIESLHELSALVGGGR